LLFCTDLKKGYCDIACINAPCLSWQLTVGQKRMQKALKTGDGVMLRANM
jgi:hypothetical protein